MVFLFLGKRNPGPWGQIILLVTKLISSVSFLSHIHSFPFSCDTQSIILRLSKSSLLRINNYRDLGTRGTKLQPTSTDVARGPREIRLAVGPQPIYVDRILPFF